MKSKVYLMISGNCGNQFFQYAFARQLQERLNAELYIDYSEIHNDTSGYYLEGSDNLLDDYNTIDYHYVTAEDKIMPVKRLIIKMLDKLVVWFKLKPYTTRKYNFVKWCAKHLERFGIYYFTAAYYPYQYPKNKNAIIYGYYESAKYFEAIDDKIKNELTPKKALLEQNQELYKNITEKQSVCITIKRMDVNNEEVADVYAYDINYFYHAVEYIKKHVENPVFVIFSDDVNWCKENFLIDGEVYYETPNNPIWEKIRLMSSCKHFIIHNSTFSWWVQHLSKNKDKIVVAPILWLQSEQPIDIYEDTWTYMTNNGEVRETHD